MSDETAENPYRAPTTRLSEQFTAKGYTPGQCRSRFFIFGVIGGLVGGAGTSALNSIAVSPVLQVLPVGMAFGVSLWLAIAIFIDRISVVRMTALIIGCLAGFAATAVVYSRMRPTDWWTQQSWTLQLLSPYLAGAVPGAFLIVAIVRAAGGKVPLRIMFIVWLFITCVGFLAFFTVDELGTRTRRFAEPTVAFFCGSGFVAVVLSMVGWQLAIANAENRGKT